MSWPILPADRPPTAFDRISRRAYVTLASVAPLYFTGQLLRAWIGGML